LLSLWFLMMAGYGQVLALDLPEPGGYVNDFAQLLSVDFEQEMNQELANLEKETTAEIAVVTVDNLQGTTIEDFAVRLFETWGIGQKGQDNGILILITKAEREVRLEVGYGLEPVITDGRAGDIIRRQMIPYFKSGDYERGVKEAVTAIKSDLKGGNPPELQKETSFLVGSVAFFTTMIFVGIFFVPIILLLYHFLGRTKSTWAGPLLGGGLGAIWGLIGKNFFVAITAAIILGIIGLFFDWLFSRRYKEIKKWLVSNSWRWWVPSSFGQGGGFGKGGSSSSGGGFGGGSSGGGGASGSW